MFLNIVTPCTRVKNLRAIEQSLQTIPRESYRWIVVFDLPVVLRVTPKIHYCVTDQDNHTTNLPDNGEYYVHRNKDSKMGNAQRNFALDKIDRGYVYFNDDDTAIHEFLWKKVKDLDEYDFIHFSQVCKDGSLRLKGDSVTVGRIDSHNFIVKRDVIGGVRWILDKYDADGFFANECYKKSTNPKFIAKVLSVYNALS